VISGLILFVAGAATSDALRQHASSAERAPVQLPAFDRAVFLSHVNDPARTPLFPGDPAFSIHAVFTIPDDGFYLELVREGAHTGTHYSAPCHFHHGALCMDDLSPSDLVLPAVVVDVREEVADDPDPRRARG
jgi:kynurenine formamidase